MDLSLLLGWLVGSSVSVSKHQFPAVDKSVLLESTEITSFTDNCWKSSLMKFLFVAFVVTIFVFLNIF